MKVGIIADDYTGGTDAASFLVEEGMSCIQLSGVQVNDVPLETDAIVVSLKSRTEDPVKAAADSVAVWKWLKKQGSDVIQFKYCSTFDSTSEGNIGPVTDAILAEAGLLSTIVVPSLPVNGRKVFYGNLFVKGEPLNESGMKDHPLTPMRDANLVRLMDSQSQGTTGLIDYETVEKGITAVRQAFEELTQQGHRYVVIDAFDDEHLTTIGAAFANYPYVTGASGLSHGLAKALSARQGEGGGSKAFKPTQGKTVVISGSCSTQTNRQVNYYKSLACAHQVDVDKLDDVDAYSEEIAEWLNANVSADYPPMVCATVNKERLAEIKATYDFDVSARIEVLFTHLVKKLKHRGFSNFICAGGETSGAVTQSLDVKELLVGKLICPGVPWVATLDKSLFLALKSGNFGDDDFFECAKSLIQEARY
ncbi:3-oxo-tetronate kinase (plasmid) [Pantoea sp. C3]|uniref:3-oxo-tetronate kinase n=1 Tax=Pantoea phytostimulans TaxID=2769024 RepID=UPI0038F6BF01